MSAAPQLPSRPPEARADGEPELETGRPSVTITRNAKGQAQFTVKVYGQDASPEAALSANEIAQRIYDGLTGKYGSAT